MKYISKKLFLIPLISLLIAAIAFPMLPDQIPTHFNFNGVPDSYNGRWFVFVIPLMSFGLTALAEVMPKLDPKQESYEKFDKAYQLMHVLINLLLLVTNLSMILYGMGIEVNIGYWIGGACGILIAVIGNYMPKFKQSFFCGIKTPWALVDEENWYKTHRFGGKAWVIGGILMAICPIFGETLGTIVLFADIILLVVLPYLYSYLIYRKKFK